MKIAFLRNFSLFTRNLLLTPPKSRPNPNSFSALFVSSIPSRFRFYSSESNSSSEPKFAQIQKRNGSVENGDGLSNQELKRQIEKYYEGDDEAIPSIFEAILKRKLSGNCGDADDDKLMEELSLKSDGDDKLMKELGLKSDGEDVKDEDSDFYSDDEKEKD